VVDEDAPEGGVVGGRASVGRLRTPACVEPCQAREGAALRRSGAAPPQACPRTASDVASGARAQPPRGAAATVILSTPNLALEKELLEGFSNELVERIIDYHHILLGDDGLWSRLSERCMVRMRSPPLSVEHRNFELRMVYEEAVS
jgi:hypothetical protein